MYRKKPAYKKKMKAITKEEADRRFKRNLGRGKGKVNTFKKETGL